MERTLNQHFFRRGRSIFPVLLALFAMAMISRNAPADEGDAAPYAGRYSNDTVVLELFQSSGVYVGTIRKGGNTYPVNAGVTPQGLAGTFTASGTNFSFTATLVNDVLTMVSDGKTYTLHRDPMDNTANAGGAPAAAPAPAQGPAPAPAPAQGQTPAAAPAPAGGLGGAAAPSDSPGVAAPQAAGSPKMTTFTYPDNSATVDLPDGWTTLTPSATHGVFVHGPTGQFVAFGVSQVIYDPNCLLVRSGQQTYQIELRTYQMQLQQWNQGAAARAQYPQIYANARAPVPPVPPDEPNAAAIKKGLPMRYCLYCNGPAEVVKNFYPIQELGQQYGKPYTRFDDIISIIPDPPDPQTGNSNSGAIYMAFTSVGGARDGHWRSLRHVITSNWNPGEFWNLNTCAEEAPDATFDQDLPVMMKITNSIKLNLAVINQQMAAEGDATRKQGQEDFNRMEKQHAEWQAEQEREWHEHEAQVAAQQRAAHPGH